MIFVQGWIQVAAKDVDTVIPGATAMTGETLKEEGCLHYCFARDIADPTIFHLTERWISEEALGAHFQTPHMTAFNAMTANITIEGMDVRMYDGREVKVMMQS